MRTWPGQGLLDSLFGGECCGKGKGSFLTMFSSAISGEGCPGPGLPVASILSSGWIWGFRRASATGGPRTLTGSSHSWKGVGHSWQGVWLRLSGSAKQIWGFRRGSATAGARTLTGSSRSWMGSATPGRGVWLQTVRLGEAWLPDALNAPTERSHWGRGCEKGRGFQQPPLPFC